MSIQVKDHLKHSFQDPVASVLNTPPVSPSVGDRYIVGLSPSGAWVGHSKDIAGWNGDAWIYATPSNGWYAWNNATATFYLYSSSAWATEPDAGLLNIVEDTTPQLGGDLDMNGHNITAAGSVAISPTEMSYVNGVSSNIQTQLNNRLLLSGGTLAGANVNLQLLVSDSTRAVVASSASSGHILSLQSLGDAELILDSNNNDTGKTFKILTNGTAGELLFEVREDGVTNVYGSMVAEDISVKSTDGSKVGHISGEQLTENRSYVLPDYGGTLALRYDLPSVGNGLTDAVTIPNVFELGGSITKNTDLVDATNAYLLRLYGVDQSIFKASNDGAPVIKLLRASGSPGSEAYPLANGYLGVISAAGYGPSELGASGSLVFQAAENFTSDYHGTDAFISLVPTGSATSAKVVTFKHSGKVGFGDPDPDTQVEVSGSEPYLTLHNTTHEDISGGRESKILFRGEQSGGEESTLASIEAWHYSTGDDQKGVIKLQVNDGNDGDSPNGSSITMWNDNFQLCHDTAVYVFSETYALLGQEDTWGIAISQNTMTLQARQTVTIGDTEGVNNETVLQVDSTTGKVDINGGYLQLNTIAAASTDTDKFLVSDSGQVKYRTGAQVLSDIGAQAAGSYAPLSHTHGNITNVGAIGTTANLPLITTTSGVITVGAFGTGSTNFAAGNHAHAYSDITGTHGNEDHSSTFITTSGVTYEALNGNSDVGTGATQVAAGNHSHAYSAITGTHGNEDHSSTFITTSGVTYEALNGNSDVGTGATQVAAGNHTHNDIYYTETELTNRTLDLTLNSVKIEELIFTDTSGTQKYKMYYDATSDSLVTEKL